MKPATNGVPAWTEECSPSTEPKWTKSMQFLSNFVTER